MLLVVSEDDTASIWNVPSGTTWPTDPHVVLEVHGEEAIRCGAFLGDDSHVITSSNGSLCIWRTSDGVQTANYKCGDVRHLVAY